MMFLFVLLLLLHHARVGLLLDPCRGSWMDLIPISFMLCHPLCLVQQGKTHTPHTHLIKFYRYAIRGAGSNNGNHFGRNRNQFYGLVTGTSRDRNRNRSQNVTKTRPPSSQNRNRNRDPGAQISRSGGPKIGPVQENFVATCLYLALLFFLLELPLVVLLHSFLQLACTSF